MGDLPTFQLRGKEVSCPELDRELLLSAERHTTGANAHAINEAVSFYKNAVRLAHEKPTLIRYLRAREVKHSLCILLIQAERNCTYATACGEFTLGRILSRHSVGDSNG